MAAARAIGSPAYPDEEPTLRATLMNAVKRSYDPPGVLRQLAAILAAGDRREDLKCIEAPSLIIHGSDDPLVPFAAGLDTAANIRNAQLLELPDVGHNLPTSLYGHVSDAIADLARRYQNNGLPR